MRWIIARTKSKRPSLMHLIDTEYIYETRCGLDVYGWSRAYFNLPVPQVACMKCTRADKKDRQGYAATLVSE